MHRRNFLKATSAAASTFALTGRRHARAEDKQRPDILLIAIEDISPHRFGCYGNKVCKTPNIDRLAASGLRFDLAHTNAAPCNPSRTSLFLGLRPETTGVYGNRDDWRKMVPGAHTMPKHLIEHGYETVRIGKMFHGSFEDDESWSRVINPAEGMPPPKNKRRPLKGPGIEFAKRKRKDKNAKPKPGEGGSGSPFVWGPSGLEDEEEKDGMIAAQAIKVLKQKQDKPLFLGVGMHAPHLPFVAPDKYFDLYPPAKIELPKNPPRKPGQRVHPDQEAITDDEWREVIAAQYATLTFVDAQIGKVLDALEETGRAGNTIVCLWSDHGYILGEHYLWRKGPLYDESARVALIIRAPGVTQAGSVCKRPVETIDLFPTFFDLCGIPQLKGCEGISMVPLLRNPAMPWRKAAITCGGAKGRSYCTERYRYNVFQGQPERTQLFDHEADPGEHVNVVSDPEYAHAVQTLSALAEGGWKACLPD